MWFMLQNVIDLSNSFFIHHRSLLLFVGNIYLYNSDMYLAPLCSYSIHSFWRFLLFGTNWLLIVGSCPASSNQNCCQVGCGFATFQARAGCFIFFTHCCWTLRCYRIWCWWILKSSRIWWESHHSTLISTPQREFLDRRTSSKTTHNRSLGRMLI